MANRNPWILSQLTLVIKPGSGVLDIIGLPLQRRITHIQVGIFHTVESTTFILLAGQSERVKHLHFVSSLDVDPTVTATLPPIFGLVR